ncbi:MAG TPA: hypothetical protein VMQ11_13485 [Alphaproteobacteria bacterium]|nr:hypothetical protein [Alphaproteobacteria bacterium]
MRPHRANIHDRTSVESIYPEPIWEEDAALNSTAAGIVHHGLLLTNGCDADGFFQLDPAARPAAGDVPEPQAAFLWPSVTASAFGEAPGVHGPHPRPPDADAALSDGYRHFIDDVLDAAKALRHH